METNRIQSFLGCLLFFLSSVNFFGGQVLSCSWNLMDQDQGPQTLQVPTEVKIQNECTTPFSTYRARFYTILETDKFVAIILGEQAISLKK